MESMFLGIPAPAKLNLFLNVLGRRSDGYHDLQTGFVAVDLVDLIDFEARTDGRIERSGDLIGPVDDDLCVRAARALRAAAGIAAGVEIRVRKRIAAGAGMGGGSSDAATTLLALNRLWRLQWPREKLAQLAPALGADVGFFLSSGPAVGEGVGERLQPLDVPALWYAIVFPQVHVATAEIFAEPALARDSKRTTIEGFSVLVHQRYREQADGEFSPKRSPKRCDENCGESSAEKADDNAADDRAAGEPDAALGRNDLQAIAARRFPEVAAAVGFLARAGDAVIPARMSGSGAAVFAAFATAAAARAALIGAPKHWNSWVVRGLDEHPLASW